VCDVTAKQRRRRRIHCVQPVGYQSTCTQGLTASYHATAGVN